MPAPFTQAVLEPVVVANGREVEAAAQVAAMAAVVLGVRADGCRLHLAGRRCGTNSAMLLGCTCEIPGHSGADVLGIF